MEEDIIRLVQSAFEQSGGVDGDGCVQRMHVRAVFEFFLGTNTHADILLDDLCQGAESFRLNHLLVWLSREEQQGSVDQKEHVSSTVEQERGNLPHDASLAEHSGLMQTWTCAACTFINTGGDRCEMCDTPKPHGDTPQQQSIPLSSYPGSATSTNSAMDFNRGASESSEASYMNKLNFKRLMKEFRDVRDAIEKGELPWLPVCEPNEDNLLLWNVDLTFPEDSPLQKSLEELAKLQFDEEKQRMKLQIRFPNEYPFGPPEVWIRRPRLKYKSAPVSFGGKLCNPLLSSQGWEPKATMVLILEQVRYSLVDAGAEVDITVSRRAKDVEARLPLDRVSSMLIPQSGSFLKENVTVMSAAEAQMWVGDVSRLEFTDNIMLPFELAEELYSNENFQEGRLFEVKTQAGRKVHCALNDFVQGLPEDYLLMPHWLMEDIFLEERDMVTVKAVKLQMCTYVKIQPHSVDFYEAVKESEMEAKVILRESISRFSALTLDTNVPIDINGVQHMVCIVDLQPAGAVKLIGHGEFDINVDFDPAPDLEDEVDKTKREKELVDRWRMRQHEGKHERSQALEAAQDKRTAAIKRHYERCLDEVSKQASADDGKEGPVEIKFRVPAGGQLSGKFREGAPAVALFAFVLRSEWAAQATPWEVQLTVFPRKVLKGTDTIGVDVRDRDAVNVREVVAPASDEELLEAEPVPSPEIELTISSDMLQIPQVHVDEEKLLAETTKNYEMLRFLRAGFSEEEALRRYEAHDLLPPDPVVQRRPLRKAPSRKGRDFAAAAERRAADERRAIQQRGEREIKINQVSMICGVPPNVAEDFLRRYNWDESMAIGMVFEQGAN